MDLILDDEGLRLHACLLESIGVVIGQWWKAGMRDQDSRDRLRHKFLLNSVHVFVAELPEAEHTEVTAASQYSRPVRCRHADGVRQPLLPKEAAKRCSAKQKTRHLRDGLFPFQLQIA